MGKPTICIGKNKGADQLRSNCEADQRLLYLYPKFQFLACFCDCTAWFVTDLVGIQIVGFLTHRLILSVTVSSILVSDLVPFRLLPFRLLPFRLFPFRLLPFRLLWTFNEFPFRLLCTFCQQTHIFLFQSYYDLFLFYIFHSENRYVNIVLVLIKC